MSSLVPPADRRALVAVDLGAESCRVSLLRWQGGKPVIRQVHRFANGPCERNGGLRWDLAGIEAGLVRGLLGCAEQASEGVRSIAVDGWAVDYVRVNRTGEPLDDPYCYRDERTIMAEKSLHARMQPARLREITGVQMLRINTLYQLHADAMAGLPRGEQWLNLPEYMLARWGGARVSEYTNATHTQMVDLHTGQWSAEIQRVAQLDPGYCPKIVPPGTVVGRLRGSLEALPAFADTVLIAPACHDTASAIAGIPASGNDWAYISSGTWSLVGTLLEQPCNSVEAAAENFTNLGGAGGLVCFHKNVNGMWLIRQCIDFWRRQGKEWTVADLVQAAERLPRPKKLISVDDPDLLLPRSMPKRINAQRQRAGLTPLALEASNAPVFANLIFHSLAARYADVLSRISVHSGKSLRRLYVVGGGSLNRYLNRLTQEATGLEVIQGAVESTTIGNCAIQLAALEGHAHPTSGVQAEHVAHWANLLQHAHASPS